MRFADITGQEELKRQLVRSIDAGRVSHALLLGGRSGAGILPLAVAFLQYLNCRHRRDGDSCGTCPDCLRIASLEHPDLHLVFPVNRQGKKSGEAMRSDEFLPLFRKLFAERRGWVSPQQWYDRLDLGRTLRGMIAAREADEIIRKLSFKSFEADYKTMLVWLPEAMNEGAANKILKILEEPWERTLFLLVSERPDRLLPTILSRTQQIHVPPLRPEVLAQYAQRHGVADTAEAHRRARLAGGDLIALEHLLAGTDDARRREDFELFRTLMRLSYNDRHLELIGPRRRRNSRASSSAASCGAPRACCARASCSTPAWNASATCGARSSPSARNSHPSSDPATSRPWWRRSNRPWPRFPRTGTRLSYSPISLSR